MWSSQLVSVWQIYFGFKMKLAKKSTQIISIKCAVSYIILYEWKINIKTNTEFQFWSVNEATGWSVNSYQLACSQNIPRHVRRHASLHLKRIPVFRWDLKWRKIYKTVNLSPKHNHYNDCSCHLDYVCISMVQIVLDLCFLHSNADKISEASQASICLEPKATITP